MRETVKMTKLKSNQKGITLIALVITIIVLLILAGVAISMLSGENGILKQAAEAKTRTEEQSTIELIKLGALAAMTNPSHSIQSEGDLETALGQQGLDNVNVNPIEGGYKVTVNGITQIISNNGNIRNASEVEKNQGKVLNQNGNTPVKDEYGNTIMVPAGFAITKDASKVEEGIVITDKVDENGNSTGNEFVWIPVNDVKTSKGTKTVTLGRYTWSGSTGTPVQTVTTEEQAETEALKAKTETIVANSSYYEVTADNATYPQSTYGNARAKKLEDFLKSSVNNGGYYIARYEAGIDGTKDNYSLSTKTAVSGTVKPQSKKGLGLWNYIKQTDASTVSQAMYTSDYFESDLINSYAWDTAIIFIQKMTDDLSYASMPGESAIDTSAPKTTGTNILKENEKVDEICNIYDMAGNVNEWSTETQSTSALPCTRRGGIFDWDGIYACTRVLGMSNSAAETVGFRPLLYVGLDSDS